MTRSINWPLQLFLVTIFFALCACSLSAQSTINPGWTRINGPKNDLSADVPADYLYDKDGYRSHFFARADRMWIDMESYTESNAKEHLGGFRGARTPDDFECSQISVVHSIGEVCSFKRVGYSLQINLATPHSFYQISVAADTSDNPNLQRFLSSIKVEDQQVFKMPSGQISDTLAEVSLSSLKPSLLILNAVNSENRGKVNISYDFGGAAGLELNTIKYSRPLIMLRRPRAEYTDRARQENVRGNVKLRIVFEGTGQISSITVLQGVEPDLTNRAIAAAKKIKFLPAEIDNKPVTVTRVVEYGFSIY